MLYELSFKNVLLNVHCSKSNKEDHFKLADNIWTVRESYQSHFLSADHPAGLFFGWGVRLLDAVFEA